MAFFSSCSPNSQSLMSKQRLFFSSQALIRGRILYVGRDAIWLAQGQRLMCSLDNGKSWKQRVILPVKGMFERLASHSLGRRLGRVGFHHFAPIGANAAVIFAHHHIFRFDSSGNKIERAVPFVGSRPLSICASEEMIYYGEYRGNSERNFVYIWASKLGNLRIWEPLWRFENIRHVHGVFYDPYENAIWVTTGDHNHEPGIWRTDDDFVTLQKIVGGSQQFRAVQLLFTLDHVYFGSDTPDDHNHIFRMDRNGKNVEQLAAVGSSVFYGCKVGNHLFFSTAVEPSRVNNSRYAELWGSSDGTRWQLIQKFKKDHWSMKYFQYGQILFPSGPSDGKNLWITPMGTKFDQKTFKIPLKELNLG